jgi:TonB-dependent starch-binding outer membrane protein SusC
MRRRAQAALLAAGCVLLLATQSRPVCAQTETGVIEGTVTDTGTHGPLFGAQVLVVGTRLGALTNGDGQYRIAGVPAATVQVQARVVGYGQAIKSATVSAGQTTTLDFALSQSAVTLSDVVVTGTGGAVQAKRLGNTVATVEAASLRDAPIRNSDDVLQGRIPGVSVLPSSGVTGEGARIRIRGNASLTQSNEPIIYLDGVRIDNGGSSGNGGATVSRLNDIDPSTIDRLEVLKGAAAATLYGTEASNGVIQIVTKKGSPGRPRWQVDYVRSQLSMPNSIEPNAGFARTQAQADGLSILTGRQIEPFVPFTVPVINQLYQMGHGDELRASVSGGAQLMTYFVSGRVSNTDGPFTSQHFPATLTKDVQRTYHFSANLGLFLGDKVHLNFRSFYQQGHVESPLGHNTIASPYALARYAKPETGYCLDDNGNRSYQNIVAPFTCAKGGNPYGNTTFYTIREALMNQNIQDDRHFNGAVTATFTLSSELTLTGTIGLDNTNVVATGYVPFGRAVDAFTNFAPEGSRSVNHLNTQNLTLDLNANWKRQLTRRFSSAFTVGMQGFIEDRDNDGGSDANFAGPGLQIIGAGNQPSVFENRLEKVNAGFLAQEQVGYDDWVFVTAGARLDYNSAFGQSAGGVVYPKVSLSIVPSDLPSWHSSLLSSFRLRAALGRAGRQPGAFDKFTTYSSLPAMYGGGLVPDNLGNSDLRPEISTEIEGGVEVGLFSDRASLSATHWRRVVNDALVDKQYPPSGGFTNPQLANIGQLKARGLELSASAYIVNRPNLSVNLFANTAYLWQKITNMGGAQPIKVGGSYIRYRNFLKEGYAPGTLFGAKILAPCGSYPTAQGASLASQNLCLQPGQLPYDLNGDGFPDTEAQLLAALGNPIDPSALKPLLANDACGLPTASKGYEDCGDVLSNYLGKPYPDWTGSFGGDVTLFTRLKLQTLFEYKLGSYTITNLTDAFRQASPTLGRNLLESAQTEATLLNTASTREARLSAAKEWLKLVALSPYDGVNQNGEGDFIRWREVSLTYTAPPSLAGRIGAQDLSVTLAARNLLLWTQYHGADPEANVQGISSGGGIDANYLDAVDAYSLPIPRTVVLTVHIGY